MAFLRINLQRVLIQRFRIGSIEPFGKKIGITNFISSVVGVGFEESFERCACGSEIMSSPKRFRLRVKTGRSART